MTFSLRPSIDADLPRIAAIISSQRTEPATVEQLQLQDRLRPAADPFLRLVATAPDGTIGAYGVCGGGSMHKPGHFDINIRVDAPCQRQGLGQMLYAALLDFAREQGATALDGSAREAFPDALAWAERRGFAKTHHVFESTFDLTAFDPAPFRDAIHAARESGIRFTNLAAFGTEEATLLRYYEFISGLAMDVPGQEDQPKPPADMFLQYLRENPKWDPELVILAVDGDRWAAVAELQKLETGGMYHGFTGVAREYRGRGLALATKLVAMEAARGRGVPYLRTNNHSSNERMLKVNRRLGYVPEPGFFTLTRDLTQ
jgi:GNAT superfamily N-acetyltransferase